MYCAACSPYCILSYSLTSDHNDHIGLGYKKGVPKEIIIDGFVCWSNFKFRDLKKQDQKSIDAIESDLVSEPGYN